MECVSQFVLQGGRGKKKVQLKLSIQTNSNAGVDWPFEAIQSRPGVSARARVFYLAPPAASTCRRHWPLLIGCQAFAPDGC